MAARSGLWAMRRFLDPSFRDIPRLSDKSGVFPSHMEQYDCAPTVRLQMPKKVQSPWQLPKTVTGESQSPHNSARLSGLTQAF